MKFSTTVLTNSLKDVYVCLHSRTSWFCFLGKLADYLCQKPPSTSGVHGIFYVEQEHDTEATTNCLSVCEIALSACERLALQLHSVRGNSGVKPPVAVAFHYRQLHVVDCNKSKGGLAFFPCNWSNCKTGVLQCVCIRSCIVNGKNEGAWKFTEEYEKGLDGMVQGCWLHRFLFVP